MQKSGTPSSTFSSLKEGRCWHGENGGRLRFVEQLPEGEPEETLQKPSEPMQAFRSLDVVRAPYGIEIAYVGSAMRLVRNILCGDTCSSIRIPAHRLFASA